MGELGGAVKKKPDGVNLNLFITTNADTSLFPSCFNQWRKRLEVKVCSKAKDNLANLEVIKIVAKFFNKAINDVYIISGKKTREKTVSVRGIPFNKAVEKLKESLDGL